MSSTPRRAGPVAAALALVLIAGLAAGQQALAVAGGTEVADGSHRFLARVDVGVGADRVSCTGALVDARWVITAKACFTFRGGSVALGAPGRATTATVGRTELTGADGHVAPVVHVVPHPDRDVVLARLATAVPGIAPLRIGTAAPAVGDVLRVAGYGRTKTDWVPDRPHTALFEVTDVGPTTVGIVGQSPEQASPCKGDAGGPALRETGSGPELVALNHASGQHGCLGATATRPGAVETRVDDLAGWVRQSLADVSVFGVLADGRLTHSAIDSASGDELTTVTSAQPLGFAPKALATVNANTLLVTSTEGRLFRVDVSGTNPALTFAPPVPIGTGWSHEHLTYDGDGSLFGIAAGTLRRYTVTSAKPDANDIVNNTVIDSGFGLKTLTATGPNWILGTTAAGALLSYRIHGPDRWDRFDLAATGWAAPVHLVSPGRGLYYGRTAAGALHRWRDAAPFDGKGTDVQAFPNDPVATTGWNQALLSAQPMSSYPQSPVDVEMYGALADGRLTYSLIDSENGDRLSTVTSTRALGFTPKTLAVLNYTTLLVTSTEARLYRVDIVAAGPSLEFDEPVQIGTGWSHDLLAYDAAGSLFGIAAGQLRRYTLTSNKPGAANIVNNTLIDKGFGLKTLTATGPGWILGTTAAGALLSYRIVGAGDWHRFDLAPNGWPQTHLVSPGNGVYYGRTAAGGLQRWRDAAPFDGRGGDIRAFPDDPVDRDGWNQVALSARPFL